jgi:hypothetical protein
MGRCNPSNPKCALFQFYLLFVEPGSGRASVFGEIEFGLSPHNKSILSQSVILFGLASHFEPALSERNESNEILHFFHHASCSPLRF